MNSVKCIDCGWFCKHCHTCTCRLNYVKYPNEVSSCLDFIERNFKTCNKVQVTPTGSPFCDNSELMGVFPCDNCNKYEPKEEF